MELWQSLRALTADPAAVAAAAAAGGLGRRDRIAVAREQLKVLAQVGGATRYEALREFLDVVSRAGEAEHVAQRADPVP
jgi:hypothetical protein